MNKPWTEDVRRTTSTVAMLHLLGAPVVLVAAPFSGVFGGLPCFLGSSVLLFCLIALVGAVYLLWGRPAGVNFVMCADVCLTIAGAVMLLISIAHSLEPLPPSRYNTDDGPYFASLFREIALVASATALTIAAGLLASAVWIRKWLGSKARASSVIEGASEGIENSG